MTRAVRLVLGLGLVATIGAGSMTLAQRAKSPATQMAATSGLRAFRSDAELRGFLQRLRAARVTPPGIVAMESVPSPVTVAPAAADAAGDIVVTGSRTASPGITNNQEVGVDEGGIVKVRGDTLVILRRGKLHTVSLAGSRMQRIHSIDAFPPGVDSQSDWYDEMLLSGDRVIVVGYSYGRGGTEINRFKLGADGRLRFEDATHLRSNDYYSSRNYASRLIGTKLVYYTPLYLGQGRDPLDALPGIRRWRGDATAHGFKRITRAQDVFIPPAALNGRDMTIDALHSVITCDLAAPTLDCTARAVLGPSSRTFYVSGRAVYLWMSDAWTRRADRRGTSSAIYRLPFGAERPSAIMARGAPVDQFSFREDAGEGMLNVLVRADAGGDAMFQPEVSRGAIALLRVPLREFGDGSREAARTRYRPLPALGSSNWDLRNRFVGNHLLYGGEGGNGGDRDARASVIAVPLRGGPVTRLPLRHGVGRIEALGRDALVVGEADDALTFSAVDLTGRTPRFGDRYTLPAASEGESRSHAFFYDPATADGASGVLGLPVTREVEEKYRRFFGSSAAMLFLRRDQRRLSPAGELAANSTGVVDDGCRASCVDWYGNARPIFLGGRTFALLGYELVEGRLGGGRIREIGRLDFAPPPVRASR